MPRWLPRGLCGYHWLGCRTEKKHHSSTPLSLSRAPSGKQWSQWLPSSKNSRRAERYSRLGCLALVARVRRPPQDTPHPHRARREAGSARQLLQRRCPPGKAGRDTPSALQRSLQHSDQLRALPRAQPRLRGSTPLAAGEAEGDLRLPDRDSHSSHRGERWSPNSCPRWRSAQACLCNSPRDAHSAIAPPHFFSKT